MKTLLKYYWNPLVLAIATVGYFSPFFLPVTRGGVSGVLVGNFILLFVAWACVAWLVAGVQVVMGLCGTGSAVLPGSITLPRQSAHASATASWLPCSSMVTT